MNKEILEKAITKAIENGWDIGLPNYYIGEDGVCAQFKLDGDMYPSDDYDSLSVNDIIFSHNFAKALWGEEGVPLRLYWAREYPLGSGGPDEDYYEGVMWQFHLQQMVVADDAIEYLGDHLDA